VSTRASPFPYLLIITGILGIVLIAISFGDDVCPGDVGYSPSPRSAAATTAWPSPSRTALQTTPAADTTRRVAAVSRPTGAPTATPISTAMPTLAPVKVSPPLVSSTGALAYVEGSALVVVSPHKPEAALIADDVRPQARTPVWSPDGRWLLYTARTGESTAGSGGERDSFYMWDSQLGETLQPTLEVSQFTQEASGIQNAIWSPSGTRILFLPSPHASSIAASVLDVTAARAWSIPGPSLGTATWIDEDTLLRQALEGDAFQLVSIGPPANILTETFPLGESYALSPDREYVALFERKADQEQRLIIQPLPGHAPLSLDTQPTVRATGREPLWSPDSRWVAYAAEGVPEHDNATREAEGAQTLIADTRGIAETRVFSDLLPAAWAPDSRLLAGFGCSEASCNLSLIDPVSGQVTTLVSGSFLRLWDMAWSPSGVYLIYTITGSDGTEGGLFLWNRGTGEQERLMEASEARPVTSLQWAPDACSVYLAALQDEGRTGLVVSEVWGIGPAWEDRWRVAPGFSRDLSSLVESLEQRRRNEGTQLCPAPLLNERRLVAYYGTPLGPGLGILGRHGITETLRLLKEQTQVYRDLDPALETIPAFHMVTTIADDYPGSDGDYNHRVAHETVQPWIDVVRAEGGWAILDLQPGRAELADELDMIEPLLLQHDVHLAVDPEFIVGEDQVPGEDLGQMTGPQINQVQARLEDWARATGQRKMLVIHQFDDRMIEQKDALLDYPLVDLLWDADGFGSPGAKTADYRKYGTEAGFEYGGFKLFYVYDEPLMTPEEVLALDPRPRLIIYQ